MKRIATAIMLFAVTCMAASGPSSAQQPDIPRTTTTAPPAPTVSADDDIASVDPAEALDLSTPEVTQRDIDYFVKLAVRLVFDKADTMETLPYFANRAYFHYPNGNTRAPMYHMRKSGKLCSDFRMLVAHAGVMSGSNNNDYSEGNGDSQSCTTDDFRSVKDFADGVYISKLNKVKYFKNYIPKYLNRGHHIINNKCIYIYRTRNLDWGVIRYADVLIGLSGKILMISWITIN